MAKDVTITARISGELGEQLTRLSEAVGRSKSWVVTEALRSYVTAESDFIAAVEAGMRDAEAGRLISHETVVKDHARRRHKRPPRR